MDREDGEEVELSLILKEILDYESKYDIVVQVSMQEVWQ